MALIIVIDSMFDAQKITIYCEMARDIYTKIDSHVHQFSAALMKKGPPIHVEMFIDFEKENNFGQRMGHL